MTVIGASSWPSCLCVAVHNGRFRDENLTLQNKPFRSPVLLSQFEPSSCKTDMLASASGFACNSTTIWLRYRREAGKFRPAALALRRGLRFEPSR